MEFEMVDTKKWIQYKEDKLKAIKPYGYSDYFEFIKDKFEEGYSLQEIGDIVGVTKNSIRQTLISLGSKMRSKGGSNNRVLPPHIIKEIQALPRIGIEIECKKCKVKYPEHLVTDFDHLLMTPLCYVCSNYLTNKLYGFQPGTPFKKEEWKELCNETLIYKRDHNRQNIGGHMLNPPMFCFRQVTFGDGLRWVDLVGCQMCDDHCGRYTSYSLMSYEDRIAELHKHGVRY
jgi:hypothetical protein